MRWSLRWAPPAEFGLVVALAAGLRLFRIDAQSLWYDEGISAFQVHRSLPEIARVAALDTHPPLYYWTLKLWAEAVGSTELGLRSLSAVCGVLAVILTWLIGRQLFGTRAATLAGLLLTWAPLAVYYSQETRMYAQLTAFALLAAWAYVRRNVWLYALAGLATLYTQYLGAAVLAALNVHALVWWRTRTRREWLGWLAANAAIGLGFLPWLPTAIDQQHHALNVSPRTLLGEALDTLASYGGGIARGDLLVVGGAALVILAVLGLALSRDPQSVSLPLLLWLAPLGLVIGLGLRQGLFETRYLLLSLPGVALLAGLGLARLPLLAVLALVPASVGLWQQYFDPTLARDDYRGLVQTIQAQARPGDAIVLSAPNQIEVFSFYYHDTLAVFPLPAQRPIDPADTLSRLEAIRAHYNRVWLVSWAMDQADPHGLIAGWLADNGFQATHQWFGTLQLAAIALQKADAPAQPIALELDNGIALEAYRLSAHQVHPGDTLGLTLVWRSEAGPTSGPWKVFAHVLSAGQVVAQRDAEPADNLRPTTTWQPGERVADNHGILIPADLPAGTYTLEVGMYQGDQRATFVGHGDHLVLGEVVVS